MGLIGINPAKQRQRGPSVLEQVAAGVGLAKNVLGLGLAIPEFLQKRETAKAGESRAAEKFPLEKRLLETQIEKAKLEATPLTIEERTEIKDKYDLASVLVPRTIGEARSRQFMISPHDERKLDQKDREIDLKQNELDRKAAEAANKKTKGKELGANAVLKVNEGNVIPTTLVNLSGKMQENRDLFGPIKGFIGEQNVYDVKAQVMDSEIRAASQQFGRFMEGGVLRKEDEEKYRKMFPNLRNKIEVADQKLNVVNRILRDKQSSDLKALEAQGFDITGLSLPPEIKFVDGVAYEKVEGGWKEVQ